MKLRTVLRSMCSVSTLVAISLAFGSSATAAGKAVATKSPSVIGFWMGEEASHSTGREAADEVDAYYEAADRQALTPDVWRVLQSYRIPLYLHVRYGRDFGPIKPGSKSDAVSLVKHANKLGIPVVAWIVIPYEQGYWAYQGNAPENFEAVKAWASWKKSNGLRFESVALDQEFSWQNLKIYVDAVTSKDPQKLSSWMRANIDPAAQCKAFADYESLINWAHRQGIKVDAAQAPMVADDLEDGDLALQNALQISASSPNYDAKYLMVYRSAYSDAGIDPGPGYLATYFRSMQKQFGPSGQISLGIPGQGPYKTLSPLADDIRMLVGLGARAIPIYSLEKLVAKFGADGLETLAVAARKPMTGAELSEFSKLTLSATGLIASGRSKSGLATKLTLSTATDKSISSKPNAWPNGCGLSSTTPSLEARQSK